MPSSKKIEVWNCEGCGRQFSSQKEAESCEKKHKVEEERNELYSCSHHQSDTKLVKHCVCCGKLVREYGELEGASYECRTELGKLITSEPTHVVLDGLWCKNCSLKLAKKMSDIIKEIEKNEKSSNKQNRVLKKN